MKSKIEISVIVPNYNHAHFLPACLDAIVNQTYPPCEILLVDDASTDNSLEIMQDYARRYPTIRLLRNSTNLGVCETINQTLPLVKGDYIALCAADDFLDTTFFEKGASFAEENPFLGLISGDQYKFIEKQPYTYVLNRAIPEIKERTIIYPENLGRYTSQSNFIFSQASLYKREVLLHYRYVNELECLCDYLLNYQIAFRHPIGYIPEPLAYVRMIDSSYGQKVRRALKVRFKAYRTLLDIVLRKEDRSFRKAFWKSDLLSCVGNFLIFTTFFSPSYWAYLPSLFYRVIRRKLLIRNK